MCVGLGQGEGNGFACDDPVREILVLWWVLVRDEWGGGGESEECWEGRACAWRVSSEESAFPLAAGMLRAYLDLFNVGNLCLSDLWIRRMILRQLFYGLEWNFVLIDDESR